ncbi:MAG TPA: MotA/TolQ/ExbB proton channel family protein [Pirellulales bacterium]|nr:MotA/TolQ/ExbB proton channel family protein [Pirellulales bacterium]
MRSSVRFIRWRTAVVLLALGCAMCLVAPASGQAPQPGSEPAVSVGDHAPLQEIPSRNLFGILRAGGMLMVPILFCSVMMLVFVFERLIALRRGRVIPRPFVKRFLHQLQAGQLDRAAALKLCAENKSPVAGVFAGGVRKWGRPAVEVEQAVLDAGERAVHGLRRYVRVFNGIATISPLLGLLGTVFGMITAFNEIATSDAMGRPELLAGGISEALLSTAFGLCVAIPALASYLFFTSRVEQLVMELDTLGQEVVNAISAEGLQEAAPRPSRRKEAA